MIDAAGVLIVTGAGSGMGAAAVRLAAGIRSQDMADALGVARITLSSYETGMRRTPDARVRAWAKVVGVSYARARRIFDKARSRRIKGR